MNITTILNRSLLLVSFVTFALAIASEARAHCDTLDGPVIKDAQVALHSGDVTPVLKWVGPEDEPEIREAFNKTLAVRKLSATARELADRFFFETLVRVHRAGEGAPYTGLKPAGSADPAVKLADEALQTGSPEKLVKVLTEAVEESVRHRYAEAAQRKKLSDRSVEAGRQFVKAYVEYVHLVEGLHEQLKGGGHRHEAPGDDGRH
ncbi:MAG: hypothetical protein H5U08_02715 [Thermogutta sp.]|uniref:DUF6448 family protein n=1 Tax=Thermogutta sp. TaxID=1962930 RepID=UPI0019A4B1D8|nr:DUF6448 family protein [Thermogutta sp.]MBC7351245.1 hypothetical protein [Thermogutta sp.]